MPSTHPISAVPAGPLVNSEWLASNLDGSRLRVLDVRGRHPSSSLPHAKRAEYAQAHIPGAVFVDWERDFVDTTDPVPVQVAAPEQFARRAGELGIGDGDLIVTYDDYYGIFAARVAWAFRLYGADSRVLDGGWTTWREEGRPVTSGHARGARGCLHPARAAATQAHARRSRAGVSQRRGARRCTPSPFVSWRGGRAEHRPHPRRAVPPVSGAR